MNLIETYAYWNFRTQQYDYLLAAPEDWSDYISQTEAAQNLYRLYQQLGDTPVDAALKVLKIAVGDAA